MSTRFGKRNVFAWLAAWSAIALGLPVFASGCGVSAEDICELKCNCEGCSQEQRDDCVAGVESALTKADDLGCSTEYGNWLSCAEQEAECRDGKTFTFDGCDIEEDALAACGGGDECAAAAKKLCDECNFSCTDPDPSACTGRSQCLSACIAKATCEDIATSGGAYATCISACP